MTLALAPPQTTEALLAELDNNVSAARNAIASAQDSDFQIPWSLVQHSKLRSNQLPIRPLIWFQVRLDRGRQISRFERT